MKAKRIFSLVLVLVMAVSLLTACGDSKPQGGGQTPGSADTQEIPESIKPTSKKLWFG